MTRSTASSALLALIFALGLSRLPHVIGAAAIILGARP